MFKYIFSFCTSASMLFGLTDLSAQSPISKATSEIPYTNCNNCWDRDSLGNHRAVVQVNDNASWVKLVLPWRRRDADPQNKRIIIQDAQTNALVSNAVSLYANRESGEIHFKPSSGKGKYFVYYMPYKNEGRSNYPKGVYLKPIANNIVDAPTNGTAQVVSFEAIDSLNSFYPMEVIATAAETKSFIANAVSSSKNGNGFIVIPENRTFPIKMNQDLPLHWIHANLSQFKGTADKGEWYAFQLGIFALQNAHQVTVQFSDLKSSNGASIPASKITCINTEGMSYDQKPFKKVVDVDANHIQALWCGVDVPVSATPGVYQGKIMVKSKEFTSQEIQFTLTITSKTIANSGAETPWNQNRLKWLNSTLAQQNDVIAPYTPLVVKGKEISLLGRKVILSADGLPAQIQTFFSPEMTEYTTAPKNILTKPMQFTANNMAFSTPAVNHHFAFTKQQKGTVEWTATTSSNQLEMQVNGSIEFDGFMVYTVKMTALENIDLNDIQLNMPLSKSAAKYMMGLCAKRNRLLG